MPPFTVFYLLRPNLHLPEIQLDCNIGRSGYTGVIFTPAEVICLTVFVEHPANP